MGTMKLSLFLAEQTGTSKKKSVKIFQVKKEHKSVQCVSSFSTILPLRSLLLRPIPHPRRLRPRLSFVPPPNVFSASESTFEIFKDCYSSVVENGI